MCQVEQRLEDRNISIELTDAAQAWIAQQGYDTWMGARPMARSIQRHIESPLALALIKDEVKDGSHVTIDVVDDHVVFATDSLEPASASHELTVAQTG